MRLKAKQNTKEKLAVGALLGGAVGYLAGILTAPKSGKQTREDIASKAGDVKNEAGEQLEQATNELTSALKAAKTQSVNMSAKAKNEFDEAVVKAKDAQNKAGAVLKAMRAGESSDPELNKAAKQARQALKNLSKYLKS
ncbi:YtxH domain-containing protein [Candidatus Saccharibacteria bacterium]|jgi:gas vesicle protein|nr:YtxH domain-containing protein [Candidatus Saccharibacteria bacterium]